MNKVYMIYPKLENRGTLPIGLVGRVPKEIQVVFTSSKAKLTKGRPYQTVTTCLLRDHLSTIGIGTTIENPNDERDEEEGKRWAFKRAIQSMLNKIDYENPVKIHKKNRKDCDRAFRLALRYAKNLK